jgi:signal transduction histidine kinase
MGQTMEDDAGRDTPTPSAAWNVGQAWLHDLRTPLTVAKLRVTLLRRRMRRGVNGADLEAELDLLEGSLNQITAVIQRMDDAARHDA